MTKYINRFHFSGLILDKADGVPLHRQLYEHIRKGILQGQIRPDTRLPATRTLSRELKISRNTVMSAYKQLIAEGYLETNIGADTRVTHTLPETILNVGSHLNIAKDSGQDALSEANVSLSEQGDIITQQPYPYWDKTGARPFSSSQPGVDEFPVKLWEKIIVSSWRNLATDDLCYPSPLGHRPLRETISTYIQASRGVKCTADQVIITNGTQQALSLIATLLLNSGDTVWVENPSYNGVKLTFNLRQATVIPIPVDEQGLIVEEGIQQACDARIAYITPSHQYPLGVTMSLTRRLELLRWAAQNDAWIIEDDYDSEIRYAGYPLEALQGLDDSGRVIYVGTFSKVLFPSLRVGFMVVPKQLVEPLRAARAYIDRGNAILEQEAINLFIKGGHLARHLRRMRTLYERRQQVLVEMAQQFLSPFLEIQSSEAGLHLIGWLPDEVDDSLVSDQLMAGGIYAPPLSYFSLTPLTQSGLVLGYATIPEGEIVTAVKKMQRILQKGSGIRDRGSA